MAQAAFSIRMDEGLKRDFSQFCDNVGMNMTTAFVIFAKATVKERRFPFEISDRTSFREQQIRRQAMEAFENLRTQRITSNEPELTLDEINAEIAAARAERRMRQLQH